jgi:hypothetical protein
MAGLMPKVKDMEITIRAVPLFHSKIVEREAKHINNPAVIMDNPTTMKNMWPGLDCVNPWPSNDGILPRRGNKASERNPINSMSAPAVIAVMP